MSLNAVLLEIRFNNLQHLLFPLVYSQNGRGKMVQLADLFSVPEISLLCNVAEYFEQEQLNYHPEILFRDVKVKI